MSKHLIERWSTLAGILIEAGQEPLIGRDRRYGWTGSDGPQSDKVTDAGLLRSRAGSGGQKQGQIILEKLLTTEDGTKPVIDVAGISASGTPDLMIRLDQGNQGNYGNNNTIFGDVRGRVHNAFSRVGTFRGFTVEVKAGGSATIDVGAPDKTLIESIAHEDGFMFFDKGNKNVHFVVFEADFYTVLANSPGWATYGKFVHFEGNRQAFCDALSEEEGKLREGRYEIAINFNDAKKVTGGMAVTQNEKGENVYSRNLNDETKVAVASYTDSAAGFGEGDVIPAIAQVADAFNDGSQDPAIDALIGDDTQRKEAWKRACCSFDKQGNTAAPIFHYSGKLWPWLSNITPENVAEKNRKATQSYDAKAKKLLKLFFGFDGSALESLTDPLSALQLLFNASEDNTPKVLQYPVKADGSQYDTLNKIMALKANQVNKTWKYKKPTGKKKNIAVPAGIKADFKLLCLASYERTISKRNKAIKSMTRVSEFRQALITGIGVDANDQLTWDGPWWTKVEANLAKKDENNQPVYAYYDPAGTGDVAFWSGGEAEVIESPSDETLTQQPNTTPEDSPDAQQQEETEAELDQVKNNVEQAAENETKVQAAMSLLAGATEELSNLDAIQTAYNSFGGNGSTRAKRDFCRIILNDPSGRGFAFSRVKEGLQTIIQDIAATDIIKLEAISVMLGHLKLPNTNLNAYIEARKDAMQESIKRSRSLINLLLEAPEDELESLVDPAIQEIVPLIANAEEEIEAKGVDAEIDDPKIENQGPIVDWIQRAVDNVMHLCD